MVASQRYMHLLWLYLADRRGVRCLFRQSSPALRPVATKRAHERALRETREGRGTLAQSAHLLAAIEEHKTGMEGAELCAVLLATIEQHIDDGWTAQSLGCGPQPVAPHVWRASWAPSC